jgi:DNA invertase Pin-like site-specific DNA recombinase
LTAWCVGRLTPEDVIERCERAGVKLATVSSDLDLSTDTGRLVGRILASVARAEVERKGARQRRAYQQAAELREPPGGPVPSLSAGPDNPPSCPRPTRSETGTRRCLPAGRWQVLPVGETPQG